MTVLTTNDHSVICQIQLTGEGRWISVGLSLGDLDKANQFLVRAERLHYEMSGVDEAARRFDLSNWQGGVISGARYAFRALKVPIRQVRLHELRGQLGGADIWAISSAAALAIARLVDRSPDFPLDLGGWAIEESAQSSKGHASPSEPLSKPAENGPPASGKMAPNGGTQALAAESGAADGTA